MRIPNNAASVTPAWLASTLDGWPKHEPIRVARIGQDQGIGGCVLRVEGPGGSVVVKLPLQEDPSSRDWLQREIAVYTALGTDAGIGVPAILYAATDDHGAVLVMEDLGGFRSGRDVVGCSHGDAELAVAALGRFHGRWMRDPTLGVLERDGVAPAVDGSLTRLVEDLNEALPKVIDRAHRLTGRRGVRLLEQLSDTTPSLALLGEGPPTLIHRDYRLDNLFFSRERDVILIDWSGLAVGNGALELGGFLGRCLKAEPDPAELAALIATYVAHAGVSETHAEHLDAALRAAYLYWLAYAVVVLGLVPMQPGPTQVVETWLRRLLPICVITGALDDDLP